MAKPLSTDLRQRVIAAIDSGLSRRQAARRFEVGKTSAIRWYSAWRAEGRVGPRALGGDRRSGRIEAQGSDILRLVEEKPDRTLAEIAGELLRRGVKASYGARWRFLKRKSISHKKKTVVASEQARPDVQDARRVWIKRQPAFDPRSLVFVDEPWTKTNMARLYGRCPRGERLVAHVPHGHWQTTTFIAALRANGITAPLVLDGPINGGAFDAYVEQFLAPTLKADDIVILDNLGSHKGANTRAAIEAVGAQIVFLPAYSPDLNPIEMAFAKLKALLRKAAERTVDGLWNKTGELLELFSPAECFNYIRHAGYGPT